MRLILASLFILFLHVSFSQEETSVLFIGNSFTFMNEMPKMFKQIAESKNKKVHVDYVVEGGKDFQYHSLQTKTYDAIKSRKWDYVILQGHSNELTHPVSVVDKNSLPFAKQIIDSIKKNNSCTQVSLYMTWGYKNGNPKWSAIATYDSMQYRIKTQYLRFADLLDTRVSPVGEVWKTIRANYPGINLYDPDLFHPSYVGSYLSACTHFATIFGESPVNNTAPILVEEGVRQIIEMNAAQVVLNNLAQWRYVPKKQLSSGFDLNLQNDFLQLQNTAKDYTWISWDFGDGNTTAEENPNHCYLEKGLFTVTQTISNACKEIKVIKQIVIE